MSKLVSVEFSLLLLVSMVAFAGFVSFGIDDSYDDLTGSSVSLLRDTGQQKSIQPPPVQQQSFQTPTWSGKGIHTFDLRNSQGPVTKISGWTSSWHSETGKYFAFTLTLKNKGRTVWSQSTGNYGGKKQGKKPIEFDVPRVVADSLEINTYKTKGDPPIDGYAFTIYTEVSGTSSSSTVSSPVSPVSTSTQQQPQPVSSTPVSPTCASASGGRTKCDSGCKSEHDEAGSLDTIYGTGKGVFGCKSTEYCCEKFGEMRKQDFELTCKQAAKKRNSPNGKCAIMNQKSLFPSCTGTFTAFESIGRTKDCTDCCIERKVFNI